jgi:hypothetical protein
MSNRSNARFVFDCPITSFTFKKICLYNCQILM